MFTVLVLVELTALAVLIRALALEADHHRVARFDGAALDRFVPRVAFAEALERLVDGLVFDGRRRLGRLDGAEVAGIETRDHVEGGLEGERLAFFEHQVLDVGRGNRLDAFFHQRVADRFRDQVLGDVLHDLRLEALADHVRRHLAGTEARDARRAA